VRGYFVFDEVRPPFIGVQKTTAEPEEFMTK
jgi:hypothetical protein